MSNQITVMPGADGIKQAYTAILKAKKADIICLSQDYEAVIGDYFDAIFAPQLYGKIKTREILPDTEDNRTFALSKNAKLNQVRFSQMPNTETDFIVTEDMVVLISFKPGSVMAVLVEEKGLVRFFGNLFEAMYSGARE